MPPKGTKAGQTPVKREASIERTTEYEDFIKELAGYHEKRGTSFEAEPKVGTRHLDLRKLYDRVVEEGGYDLVSDTKAKPLMWRKVAEEFLGRGPHLAAQAFMVKSAYYKNLVAYEISTHWGKVPPPKEILEDLTAKGGNVMDRSLETFERPHTREEGNLANGNSSDGENEDRTPKQEKMEVDEIPGSATGRSTRGLRHAPPQRVLFQPDTVQPQRLTRNLSNHHVPSPSPATTLTNGFHPSSIVTNATSMTLASYEPSQPVPLSLKPVITPGNNPDHYKLKRKLQQDARASHVAKKYKGLMLPGTGFIGPNIYVRAQLALQSGIPEEEQYALHHLVKISHERGDKYRFDQFAGLAEALVAKLLKIANLFYDIDWSISYHDDEDAVPGKTTYLDGIHGTADVLDKLKSNIPLDTDDHVQPSEFALELGRVTEAALVIRNMVMLQENARYIAKLPLIRDYFCIVLNLDPHPAVVELQNYALETAEQLTQYFDLDSQDPLYHSLLAQLKSNDRGKIIPSLRAISRIGMDLAPNKRLEDIPISSVNRVCEWLMVDDEELRSAVLDFLFQYTSIAENVHTLVLDTDIQSLVRQLSNLLLFQAKPMAQNPTPQPTKEEEQLILVPRLAPDLVRQLLRFTEPERSSYWLQMCFQDDPNQEMTQIHLWQSYQATFLPYVATHPHLIAGDFIKNVSTTFAGATAQVAGSNKYVIRGIKPRTVPVDYKGRELVRCQWRVQNPDMGKEFGTIFSHSDGKECGAWYGNSEAALNHVLTAHLNVPKKAQSVTPDAADPAASRPPSSAAPKTEFDFAQAACRPDAACKCAWNGCTHSEFTSSPANLALLARHIETHLPEAVAWKKQHHQEPDAIKPVFSVNDHIFQQSMQDERGDAAGVPLGCALVLRNIARAIPRLALPGADATAPTNGTAITALATTNAKEAEEPAPKALMKKIFTPIKDRLFDVMAHNKVLKLYIGIILRFISQGGG